MQTPPMDNKLTVKDLNFYYGKFHAIKNVNMVIPDKKVVAFIGPSGCGKSTLLRTFNRIFELYPKQTVTGEVLLNGTNILDRKQDTNKIRAKIGMVSTGPDREQTIFMDDFRAAMGIIAPRAGKARVGAGALVKQGPRRRGRPRPRGRAKRGK